MPVLHPTPHRMEGTHMTIADIQKICDDIHDALTITTQPPGPKPTLGTNNTTGSRPPLPVGILDAHLDLKQKLISWALLISEEGEYVLACDDNELSIAGWIYTKAAWLNEHPAASDFITEMTETIRALTRPYTSPNHMLYCGEVAGEPIWARPHQATVTLPDGRIEQVQTLRTHMAANLLDHVGSVERVAEIIRVFHGFTITWKQIAKTASNDRQRGHPTPLEPVRYVAGRPHYRVGDVLKRLAPNDKTTASA